MKKKILALSIGCIITVAALATIQGYFIYNTYKLKEKEANTVVKEQLQELENTEEWDSILEISESASERFIEAYKKNKTTKADYMILIEKNRDTLSQLMAAYIEKNKTEKKYAMDYSIYMVSATVRQDGKTDTLLNGKVLLLGGAGKEKDEIYSGQGRWESAFTTRDDTLKDIKKHYNIEIKTKRYYSIEDWEKKIINQMAGLLVFSIVLVLIVICLFYMSIKSLISQKKIADIKTDFINNITHEFQTPLATMDIAIKTVTRKKSDMSKADFEHTLSLIERQNERLQKLFRQVAEVSVTRTPSATAESLITDENSLRQIIEDFQFSRPDIQINYTPVPPVPELPIELFHLSTMVINLLDNAVKYGATQINVGIHTSGPAFHITVQDNGIGINKKEQSAIFDKFYRVEKGNIHMTKGLGLGLFYIHQIATSYRGTVTVSSEEGKGALFTISIPLP